jgi:hypothetical protein
MMEWCKPLAKRRSEADFLGVNSLFFGGFGLGPIITCAHAIGNVIDGAVGAKLACTGFQSSDWDIEGGIDR